MRDIRIAVIGAGPGGIAASKYLQDAGFDNFSVFEKAPAAGGTWLHNRYPGAACDIQCQLYSFEFDVNPHWSRPYPRQPEILSYLQAAAAKFGVDQRCRYNTGIAKMSWDDEGCFWNLTAEDGQTHQFDVVISAVGMFNQLRYPDIAGTDDYQGHSFHTARWDTSHDLTGKTVGVIGSAASAVQAVPEIAKVASQVHLFQRTPNWVLPKDDTPYTPEELAAHAADPSLVVARRTELFNQIDHGTAFGRPGVVEERQAAALAAIDEVHDAKLRAQLTPTHPWGCKRPLFSNDYYAAFNRANLELVTQPISHISAKGVVTTDNVERSVDTLIYATGFQTTKFVSAIDVVGRNNTPITDAWSEGAQAYIGVTTSGFPNLFMLYGPNMNNGSLITMGEIQARWAVQQIARLARENLAFLDVRPDAMAGYNQQIQDDLANVSVWHAGCNSYYRAPNGRIVTQWPHGMTYLEDRLAAAPDEHFELVPNDT